MSGFGILVWTALCFYGWIKAYGNCTSRWAKVVVTLIAFVAWAAMGSKMGLGSAVDEVDTESHRP